MPVSTAMGNMPNNLVVMLCGVYSLLIYQTHLVHTICFCIRRPLYVLQFIPPSISWG